MRWIPAAALAALLVAGAACASAYDEFGRGIDANNHGDQRVAIDAFTQALEAGDLPLAYVPSAYLGRARGFLDSQRCAEAVADIDSALRFRPDYADAFWLRARAEECLGKPEVALRDITAAISLKPVAGYYFARARLLWSIGRYRDADLDANAAVERDPSDPYYVIWTAVIGGRVGRMDRTNYILHASMLPESAWPRPVVDLFGGRSTPDEVYRAAAAGPGRTPANQKCEADFYVGEWHLLHGAVQVAKRLIAVAADECPRSYLAREAAVAELKRLDLSRTASIR